LFLSQGQAGEAWELSNKRMFFRKQGALEKKFSFKGYGNVNFSWIKEGKGKWINANIN
jgi:hypothetical protein